MALSESVKNAVLAAIDKEINDLQAQREFILNGKFGLIAPTKGKPGPKGTRVMSDEARKAIGDAARKRHAAKREEKARLESIQNAPAAPVMEVVEEPEPQGTPMTSASPKPKPNLVKKPKTTPVV